MQPIGVLEKSKATKNPLRQLLEYGQSMWLDYIRRDLFTTGKLKQLIDEDGLLRCVASMRSPSFAMDMSAWRSLHIWHSRRRRRSTKRAACGRR